jgi:hypothetical protein
VEFSGFGKLHSPFLTERRTRGLVRRCVAGNPDSGLESQRAVLTQTPKPRVRTGIGVPLDDPQVSKARPGPPTHGFGFMEVVLAQTLSPRWLRSSYIFRLLLIRPDFATAGVAEHQLIFQLDMLRLGFAAIRWLASIEVDELIEE